MDFEALAAPHNAQVMAEVEQHRASLAATQWHIGDLENEIQEITTNIAFNPHWDDESKQHWRGILESMEEDLKKLARDEGHFWHEIGALMRTLKPTTPYFKRD